MPAGKRMFSWPAFFAAAFGCAGQEMLLRKITFILAQDCLVPKLAEER